MKYMHFNSSCSFTALAMLLEDKGINTEDTEIALEEGLPWIFVKENDCFRTGAMLQSKEWFDIFLNPRGLCLVEEYIEKNRLPEYLRVHKMCMLGIKLSGIKGKHAIVFYKYDGHYHFYNPIPEESEQKSEITLSESELLDAVDSIIVVGHLAEHEVSTRSLDELVEKSMSVLQENYKVIEDFCIVSHTEDEYREAMDKLFRSLLLDGITMLNLIAEKALSQGLKEVQQDYMRFMKEPKTGRLADVISLIELKELIDKYEILIRNRLQSISMN